MHYAVAQLKTCIVHTTHTQPFLGHAFDDHLRSFMLSQLNELKIIDAFLNNMVQGPSPALIIVSIPF